MSEKDRYPLRDDLEPTRRRFVKQVTAGAVGLTAGQMLPAAAVAEKKKQIDTPEGALQGMGECLAEARQGMINTPTGKALELSEKARTAPLESKWLTSVRDTLLRQNTWENLPLHPQEILVVQPQVAEVVTLDPGQNMPVDIYSMGYGAMEFDWRDMANSFDCSTNNCGTQWIGHPDGDGTSCGENSCENQICHKFTDCSTHDCSEHHCGDMGSCGFQMANITDMVQDLRSNFSHPFVQGLMYHFEIRNLEHLAPAVQSYVTQNAYDASVLARLK